MKWLLGLFVAAAAVLTLDLTLNLDLFGLLANRTANANTVIGGWNLFDPQQAYIGFARLLYPFFCGLLLSRIGLRIKLRGGFLWCSVMIAVLLIMPFVSGGLKGTPSSLNGIYNAVVILALFPLIVAIGAGSSVEGRREMKICKFLGDISYPLYITHYPLLYCQMSWAMHHPLFDSTGAMVGSLGAHIMVAVGFLILSIGVAYACLKLYDEPVREWLKTHWLNKKKVIANR